MNDGLLPKFFGFGVIPAYTDFFRLFDLVARNRCGTVKETSKCLAKSKMFLLAIITRMMQV